MSFAPVSRGCTAVVTALCLALVTDVAFAQPSEAGTPSLVESPPPARRTGPLRVRVVAHGVPFDKAKLRTALSQELGRPVVLVDAGAGDVNVELNSATHADVTYMNPTGTTFRRGVDLPPDRERSVQVVSWLVVNLVRNEAAELLEELRARRKMEAEAEARAAAEKAIADKAVADKAAADKEIADKATAELLATDKAKSDKAAADKAAAAKAAADKARGPVPPPPPLALPPLLRDPLRSIDVALATPISFLRDSPRRELHLQLALAYGESGAITGAAVSPMALRLRRDLLGAAVGSGAVIVGGDAQGAVVSVGYAQVSGNLEGALLGAGAAVQRGERARGAILAVGGAMSGETTGFLAGAGFATATSLQGVALSAGATIIRGPAAGVVIAGGANSSADHSGLQIAGGANVSGKLQGFALAPINVHGNVKGVQLGIVNVAEEVDGAALGIVSLSKNGRLQPVFWGSNNGAAHLALKSIAGWAFTQIGGGVDLDASEFTYDGGVGLHLRLGKLFFLEPGVHYSAAQKLKDTTGSPDAHRLHYVAQVGLRLSNKLDLLAGGGVRHTIAGGTDAPFSPEIRAGIAFF